MKTEYHWNICTEADMSEIELNKGWECPKCREQQVMKEENENLVAKLEKAKEALVKIENLPPIRERDRRTIAREALRELEEEC